MNSGFFSFCFKLSSTEILNNVWFFICKSLKGTNFYIICYIFSLLSFLFMHIQLTVLSLISLVCTKEAWVFCYYIIKYLCHFDVKFPEVVSVERLSWWFGLYVYYLIYPWTLKTRFSVVHNTKRYRRYPYQIIHVNKLGGSF